jgi:hypothetical protein
MLFQFHRQLKFDQKMKGNLLRGLVKSFPEVLFAIYICDSFSCRQFSAFIRGLKKKISCSTIRYKLPL